MSKENKTGVPDRPSGSASPHSGLCLLSPSSPSTSSARRKASSRANGARSYGPRTIDGKERAAGHNLRHGILAQTIVLSGENREAFKRLSAEMHAEFNPQTLHECLQVEKMVAATWRLQRLWSVERENIQQEVEKQDPENSTIHRTTSALRAQCDASRFQDVIHRYEVRYDRQYSRAFGLLVKTRQLQNVILPFEPSPKNEQSPSESQCTPSSSSPSSLS